MDDLMSSACSECSGGVRPRTITQEYEREGVTVSISGIRAWVCDTCGEIYFPPGGAQAVVVAANGLFALARNNRQHKGKLTSAARRSPSKRKRKVPVGADGS